MRLQLTTRQFLIKRGGLAVEIRPSVLSKNTGCATPAEYIKTSRLERGLRQSDLASHLGVHKTTVRVWEKGKKYPRMKQWEKLIEVLGLSPNIIHELLLEAASNKSAGHGRFTALAKGGMD